mmetsp:Transcript_14822/g.22795  ORF Transcript_14822/g.22795 Transcript_14822/m.22795 type:complete len:114 (-) Transcript_14822:371-712(-)
MPHACSGWRNREMAKLQGATVVATASSHKLEAAQAAGADHILECDNHCKFASKVKDLFPNGVDVVYDSIGLKTADELLSCLKLRGACVLYGNSSGSPAVIFPTPTLAAGSWCM